MIYIILVKYCWSKRAQIGQLGVLKPREAPGVPCPFLQVWISMAPNQHSCVRFLFADLRLNFFLSCPRIAYFRAPSRTPTLRMVAAGLEFGALSQIYTLTNIADLARKFRISREGRSFPSLSLKDEMEFYHLWFTYSMLMPGRESWSRQFCWQYSTEKTYEFSWSFQSFYLLVSAVQCYCYLLTSYLPFCHLGARSRPITNPSLTNHSEYGRCCMGTY